MTEEDIVRRALGKSEYKGVVRFPYEDEAALIDVVKARFPAATHLFICNLDKRDTLNSPQLTSRRIRGIKLSICTRTGSYSSTHVEAIWHEVFVVVEKGMATLKVARCSIGETTT